MLAGEEHLGRWVERNREYALVIAEACDRAGMLHAPRHRSKSRHGRMSRLKPGGGRQGHRMVEIENPGAGQFVHLLSL
jgi:hypothetical protein